MEEEKKAEGRRQKAAPLSVGTPTSPPLGERKMGGEKAVVYFTSESWKGVKTVFKCARCGAFRDERDAMIEHVLLHYPKGEQERILETLLKEK